MNHLKNLYYMKAFGLNIIFLKYKKIVLHNFPKEEKKGQPFKTSEKYFYWMKQNHMKILLLLLYEHVWAKYLWKCTGIKAIK